MTYRIIPLYEHSVYHIGTKESYCIFEFKRIIDCTNKTYRFVVNNIYIGYEYV